MNKRKKIILVGILLGLVLMCTISVCASIIFRQETGPIDIIEPIEINMLEIPNITVRSIYPGENIIFKYQIKNIADRDYWITGRIWHTFSKDNLWVNLYGEIIAPEGKESYRPGESILIRAKTTYILTLTLEIREDSPVDTGGTFYSRVTRIEDPAKGIG